MDPRRRADEALARASARGAFVVTPDNATSPMDSSATVRIPRETITQGSEPDPEDTAAFPQQLHPPIGWPQHDSGQVLQYDEYQAQYYAPPPPQQQRPYPQR
jgi:hypothetical protein